MIVDARAKTAIKVHRRALVVILIIGCLSSPVIDDIDIGRLAWARTASNEGWIVYLRYYSRDEQGLWIMNANGKNERQLTHSRDEYPKWSPDGQQIAFVRWSGDARGIYIMNGDGSIIRRVKYALL